MNQNLEHQGGWVADTENRDDLDEAALAEQSKKVLARIREKEDLERIPNEELKGYMEIFSQKRSTLTRLIRRPKDHDEVSLMKNRSELLERLNLLVGTIEGELDRRRKIQSWSF